MRFIFLLLFWSISWALNAEDILKFDDPEKAKRFAQLQHEIRCPKCQNQSIADSAAGISEDLRNIIYDKMAEDFTDDEIKLFLKERYGDFILYKPEVKGTNLIIWFGPGIIFIAVVSFLVINFRKRNASATLVEPLSQQENSELEALLNNSKSGGKQPTQSTSSVKNERRDA